MHVRPSTYVQYTHIVCVFLVTWIGAFPIDIDLTRRPPGVYTLEITATDVFSLSDRNIISYTSGYR